LSKVQQEHVVEKQRILIVEDDLDLSEMLDNYFSVQNYQVMTAAWGEDALRISREEDLHLIVLDIRLPDINGYEVCRQLRSQRRTQDIPIIFLTEKRDRVDKLQGLELGVVDYITKPFDIAELRLRVRNAIERAERQALINPITELPEAPLFDERLNTLLYSDQNWAAMSVRITGLPELRSTFGFVASDEVLRAVALMVRNAVREYGNEDDLIAHLTPESLVVLTSADRITSVRERVETRIRSSIEHFYPPKAREVIHEDLLELQTEVTMMSDGPFKEAEQVRERLIGSAE
jgi:PleD family two-component response regulator